MAELKLVTDLTGTPFEGYTATDWALRFIGDYGQIDGDHHKLWVLDQVARILHGTKVEVTLATFPNGEHEYRYETSDPSPDYLGWVEDLTRDDDGNEYDYDEGIAP